MTLNTWTGKPNTKNLRYFLLGIVILLISMPVQAANFTFELGPEDTFTVKGSDGNSKFSVDDSGIVIPSGAEMERVINVEATIDPVENGTMLRDAVEAIGNNPGEIPYLLQLDPGIYDLGTERLYLPQWVSLVGAGQRATIIRGHGGTTLSRAFTVLVRRHSDIRDLTIESVGDSPYLVALASWSGEGYFVSVSDVLLSAKGGGTGTVALHIDGGYDIRFNHVVAEVTDPGGTSESTSYTGCLFENFDMDNFLGSTAQGLECRAHGQKGKNIGIRIESVEDATFRGLKAQASGAPNNIGLVAINSSADFFDSHFKAAQGTTQAYAVSISQSLSDIQPLRIFNSILGSNSAPAQSDGNAEVHLLNSQLAGGTNQAANMKCVAVHDGNLNYFADSCPP